MRDLIKIVINNHRKLIGGNFIGSTNNKITRLSLQVLLKVTKDTVRKIDPFRICSDSYGTTRVFFMTLITTGARINHAIGPGRCDFCDLPA